MLAPAVTVLGVVFLGGLTLGVLRSLGVTPFGETGGPTLAYYARALAEPGLGETVAVTICVAAVSASLSTVGGIAAALLVRRAFRVLPGSRAVAFLFQLNLTVPHVVAAVGILALFSQSGHMARLLHGVGVIEVPADMPVLTQDPWAIGIILAYTWKEIPFVGVVVLSLLAAIGDGPADVARTLGATRWQAFRHVTLPLIMPGILASSAIVFAFALGAFEVPAVLGASHPQLLPVLAYEMFTSNDIADRPAAIALSLMTAAVAALTILAYRRLAAYRPAEA